jgi:4'-phosphopantetheinyl transferase
MTNRTNDIGTACTSNRASPPMTRPPSDNEVHLLVLRLDEARFVDDDISADDVAVLATDERHRAAEIATPRGRHQYTVCRIALRRMVALCTDVAPADVRFDFTPLGKPLLADRSRRLAISVSHSGDVGLIAVAGAARLGVDVQRVDPGIDAVGLAQTAFAPEEIAELRLFDGASRTELFYRLWTHREAVAKALGVGLRVDPTQLCIDVTSGPKPRIVRSSDSQRDLADWTLRHIDIASNDNAAKGEEAAEYRAALAIDRPLRHIHQFECHGLAGLADALAR